LEDRVGRELLERRIPWPRTQGWRPGAPITLPSPDGGTRTYRLWSVQRDPDPTKAFATVSLEPIDAAATGDGEVLSQAG
jgi:hypothetical protein